jgi:hypothetical protein
MLHGKDCALGRENPTFLEQDALTAFLGFAFGTAGNAGMDARQVYEIVGLVKPGGVWFRDVRETLRHLRKMAKRIIGLTEMNGRFYYKKNGVQAKPALSLCGTVSNAKLVNAA